MRSEITRALNGRAVGAALPEPEGDLKAQIRAMLDPASPKDTMVAMAPDGSGLLATTDPAKLRQPDSERDFAELLDYPHDKDDVLRGGGTLRVAQVRDPDGHVIQESVTAEHLVPQTMRALRRFVPVGGLLIEMNPLSAQQRRQTRGQ